jgi:hypothetical protein
MVAVRVTGPPGPSATKVHVDWPGSRPPMFTVKLGFVSYGVPEIPKPETRTDDALVVDHDNVALPPIFAVPGDYTEGRGETGTGCHGHGRRAGHRPAVALCRQGERVGAGREPAHGLGAAQTPRWPIRVRSRRPTSRWRCSTSASSFPALSPSSDWPPANPTPSPRRSPSTSPSA